MRSNKAREIPRELDTSYAWLAIILGFSLLIRLLYLFQVHNDIFMRFLIIDAKFYDAWAKKILLGDWLGHNAFYQDPYYAYFLAFFYKIFGPDPTKIRVLQAIFDTGTVFLIYVLGKSIFDSRTGLIACGLASLYGPMVCYTALLDKTTISLFLITLSLATIILAADSAWLGPLLSGIIWGTACLIRGNMLVVLIGASLWLLFQNKRTWRLSKNSFQKTGIFLIGSGLVIGSIAFRNYWVSRDFVLLTSNAGLNFFIGNNPHTAGNYLEPPFIHGIPEDEYSDSKLAAEHFSGRSLPLPSQVSRFWLRQGLRFVFNDPYQWAILMLKKVFLFLN